MLKIPKICKFLPKLKPSKIEKEEAFRYVLEVLLIFICVSFVFGILKSLFV